jgi:acid phosphatase (class A)
MLTKPLRYRAILHLPLIVILVGLMATVWNRAHFLEPGEIDYKTILPGPPAPDSDVAKQDIDEVLQLQESRTPAEIEHARSEVDLSPYVFSQVIGPWFSPDIVTQTDGMLREVDSETAAIVDQSKKFYARPRPFVADSRAKPCVQLEDTFSYPSGHATHSMLLALVLSEIFPEKRNELILLAQQIGHDRVLGGVHYPSDVEAGQKLAEAIFNAMKQSPNFQQQIERAKIECEWRKPDPQFYVASGE